MSDEIEVTERGEIVAHGEHSDAWIYNQGDRWCVCAETCERGSLSIGETSLTREHMVAWLRRALRELEGGARGGDEAE